MKIKVGAEKLLLALPIGDGTQPTRPDPKRIEFHEGIFKQEMSCLYSPENICKVNLLCQKNGIR